MRLLIPFLFLLPAVCLASSLDRPWNHDTIYFAMTDRFHNGDPANDVPAGSDPALFDKQQKDIGKYHGGDFRGLEIALQRGYFKDLGITALWLTPPVRNVWNSQADLGGPKTGYHGYWTQDFLDIDPHLTSATSLDEKTKYPDSRDGRMQHYKDLVALAHSQGIKVIQDIVLNHVGPVFYYDVNGNGAFDVETTGEWIQPFRDEGFYDNAKWADLPKWNARKVEPSGPVTVLGKEVKTTGLLAQLSSYSRKGFSNDSLSRSGTDNVCDFFALRDIWTDPESATFDQLVAEFVAIYAFYIEEIGVDGLRVDTVKHLHHAFITAFTDRLRVRLGPERAAKVFIFGEIYDGNATATGKYTFRTDWPENKGPCLDSVLNFTFCFGVRSYLRPVVGPYEKAGAVEDALRSIEKSNGFGRPRFNPVKGADGLDSRQKLVNFVENHDGLNRFRVGPITEKQNILANALTLLSEGVPCLYYGTEAAMHDAKGKVTQESEGGRLTFVPTGSGENFDHVRKTPNFLAIAALNGVRNQIPALQSGITNVVWTDSTSSPDDDGVFAFIRYLRNGDGELKDGALVVINASERPRVTSAGPNRLNVVSRSGRPLMTEKQKLVRVPLAGLDPENTKEQSIKVVWHDEKPQVELILAPQSVNVYRIVD